MVNLLIDRGGYFMFGGYDNLSIINNATIQYAPITTPGRFKVTIEPFTLFSFV